jgi:hypothetical protein
MKTNGRSVVFLLPALTPHGNGQAAAIGDAARWWLLGVLTCLCLGILVAAIAGGVYFARSRRKPKQKLEPTPFVNQTLAPFSSKPFPVVPEPATLPKARLVVLHGLVDRQFIELETQPITIGRDTSNSLVVNDSIASRHHARVVPEDNAWVILDTHSANGTLVNGKSVGRHVLTAGDRIEIGTAVLEFLIVT